MGEGVKGVSAYGESIVVEGVAIIDDYTLLESATRDLIVRLVAIFHDL